MKLIHWGADIIVTQELGHEHLKAQLAYFLYAWPALKAWLPEQNYQIVRDYAFKTWANPKSDRTYPYDESPEHNLLALKTKTRLHQGRSASRFLRRTEPHDVRGRQTREPR